MDTTELLKRAMAAVKEAGVPEQLQAMALQLAVEDLRASDGNPPVRNTPTPLSTDEGGRRTTTKRTTRPVAKRVAAAESAATAVLASVPDEAIFFKAIEKETSVTAADLGDIFHIEGGLLSLKVASKELGKNNKASTQTVTALLGGAVFAGTGTRKLAFGEINNVCTAKHCFDSANSAAYIKSTPGFASVGARREQALVSRNGWQNEFAKATRRVLGKPEPTS